MYTNKVGSFVRPQFPAVSTSKCPSCQKLKTFFVCGISLSPEVTFFLILEYSNTARCERSCSLYARLKMDGWMDTRALAFKLICLAQGTVTFFLALPPIILTRPPVKTSSSKKFAINENSDVWNIIRGRKEK